MNNMTKKEIKDLLEKVTVYVSEKLRRLKNHGTLTDLEVSKACGLQTSRISELRYYKQYRVAANGEVKQIYKTPLFLNQLERMIAGGLITVTELKENLELNAKEDNFINHMIIFEDDLLRMAASELKRRGYDPGKVLLQALKAIKSDEDLLSTDENQDAVLQKTLQKVNYEYEANSR